MRTHLKRKYLTKDNSEQNKEEKDHCEQDPEKGLFGKG